ncbi:MAG: LysR family transcriptional regulator [Novosphingobium sp.]|nr:LysR family transcriptional regulator [Novosphingobium sp.]
MDFDLTRLRHIVAVARKQSFSRAAEELYITQPALSRSIAAFERRFGLRLFDRGRGGVVMTAAGKLVVEEAERLLRSASDLEHNLKLYSQGKAGRVALGLGPLAASLILPRLSHAILQDSPSLQLRASIKPAEQLLQELLADDIEMIFANSWTLNVSPELEVTPVGSVSLEMIVRGKHPLAARRTVRLSDLRSFPATNAVELPAAGLTGEAGALVCDNFHIMREAVLGTNCVWLAPPELFEDDIESGRLRVLKVADFGPLTNVVSMIRRKERTMSAAAVSVARTVQSICSSQVSGMATEQS